MSTPIEIKPNGNPTYTWNGGKCTVSCASGQATISFYDVHGKKMDAFDSLGNKLTDNILTDKPNDTSAIGKVGVHKVILNNNSTSIRFKGTIH